MPYFTVEVPAIWVGILCTAIAAVVLAVYLFRRRRDQREEARRVEAEAIADRDRRWADEASRVRFIAKAWVPYGAPDEPEQAPLAVAVDGGPAWIHEVRLSFGSPDHGPRSAVADMRCRPWSGGHMPVKLLPRDRVLTLDWPLPRMLEPEPISWELDVVWSLDRDGLRTTAVVPGSDTDWRHA